MSKVAYLLAANIHDAQTAAAAFGWDRLGSSRFAGPGKQDIRLAYNPGQIVPLEHPTSVYREAKWPTLWEKWDEGVRKSFNDMLEAGQIELANGLATDEPEADQPQPETA